MKLSVGPLLYYWERERVFAFYRMLASAPIDCVYLGEVVCSKRRALKHEDWAAIGRDLADAGKEVIFSTLALMEAESELSALARLAAGNVTIEANDMAAVHLADGRPFVAGPHLNVYNGPTLRLLGALGARRWVAPLELDTAAIADLLTERPQEMECEVFAYGRMPLAFSARCFSARVRRRNKDECDFVCGEEPDGLTVYTREHQPLFALNGVQTQSAQVRNLLTSIGELQSAGVQMLRISPHSHEAVPFTEVIEAFAQAVRGDQAVQCPASALPGGYCSGPMFESGR
ncbi:MAG: ubiquinone anaerobic biosynthesis protein UbiV [Steroidobacteraceae bacterium]